MSLGVRHPYIHILFLASYPLKLALKFDEFGRTYCQLPTLTPITLSCQVDVMAEYWSHMLEVWGLTTSTQSLKNPLPTVSFQNINKEKTLVDVPKFHCKNAILNNNNTSIYYRWELKEE